MDPGGAGMPDQMGLVRHLSNRRFVVLSQQTRHIDPMPIYCWASWPNIKSALDQLAVFAGVCLYSMLVICTLNYISGELGRARRRPRGDKDGINSRQSAVTQAKTRAQVPALKLYNNP